MLFKNEYKMTHGRYVKWAVPTFYKVPAFYLSIVLGAVAVYAYFYFAANNVPAKWKTLAVFVVFICVYRGIFYKYMAASKYYRLSRDQFHDGKEWPTKVEIMKDGVKVLEDGKKSFYANWDTVVAFKEAKSFYDLFTEDGKQARLDKKSFTQGTAQEFLNFMQEVHAEIPYSQVESKLNK